MAKKKTDTPIPLSYWVSKHFIVNRLLPAVIAAGLVFSYLCTFQAAWIDEKLGNIQSTMSTMDNSQTHRF